MESTAPIHLSLPFSRVKHRPISPHREHLDHIDVIAYNPAMHDEETLRAHLPGQMLRTLTGADTLPLQQISALLEAHEIDERLLRALGYLAKDAYLMHRADRPVTPQSLTRLVKKQLSDLVQPGADPPSASRTSRKP